MNINTWISNINSIDNNFLLNKQYIISFLELCTSKHLSLTYLDFQPKIKNMLKNDYIIAWDCEFQTFKATNQFYKCKSIQYEQLGSNKMIRAISELGGVLLFNIKGKIYLAALFQCSFLNNRFNKNMSDYIPFYHEYLSVGSQTEKMIVDIERKLYPHQIFNQAWNKFTKSSDTNTFTKDIVKLLNYKLLRSDKVVFSKFKHQINHLIILLESTSDIYNEHITKAVSKIMSTLKNIIYTKTIKHYENTQLFKLIYDLYINDDFIKKILIPPNNHNALIYMFNEMVVSSNAINIVKGGEDLKALINHKQLLSNCKDNMTKAKNVIDIADYNNNIYTMCSSAKLYESYVCLIDKRYQQIKKYHEKTEDRISTYMNKIKPHNPLVDAYYTLYVYIQYNLLK